jgi:hypothetical protein
MELKCLLYRELRQAAMDGQSSTSPNTLLMPSVLAMAHLYYIEFWVDQSGQRGAVAGWLRFFQILAQKDLTAYAIYCTIESW